MNNVPENRMLTDEQLKAALLDILVRFDAYCRAHDLSYSLMAGTLLGAVRHKGFIPWDDDIDVGMARPIVEKLIAQKDEFEAATGLRIEGYQGLPLEDAPFPKVVDPTIVVQPDKERRRSHLWVDLYIVDAFPDDDAELADVVERVAHLQKAMMFLASTPESGRTLGRRLLKHLATPVASSNAPLARYGRKLTAIALERPYGSTRHVGSLVWGLGGKTERIGYDGFEQKIELEFEGHSFMVMSNWEEYLTSLHWGDSWKWLPPEDQRVSHGITAWREERAVQS